MKKERLAVVLMSLVCACGDDALPDHVPAPGRHLKIIVREGTRLNP